MTWQDRILEAAYTSPSGQRVTFDFENVSTQVDKKTVAFSFPDAPGTYIQDLGHTGRRYPLRVIFWGGDHDLQADLFDAMLMETGAGFLDHPFYGSFDVVPFGTITRRDDLKTAANQTIVEVVFWQTIGLVYPSSQSDPASDVLLASAAFEAAQAEKFAASVATTAPTFKAQFKSYLDTAKSGLQAVANAQQNVQRQFDAVYDSIDSTLDVLVGTPLTLAQQTLIMLGAPGRALASLTARLDAYGNLFSSIIGGPTAGDTVESGTRELYAAEYVNGSVISAVNNQFDNRSDALETAEALIAQFDDFTAWIDTTNDALGVIDTGETYQALQQAVALAAGYLVEISFTLKREQRIVLVRNRSIIDLVAELYGSVDDYLDFFINTNDLTGSEILELPAGRTIVYYV